MSDKEWNPNKEIEFEDLLEEKPTMSEEEDGNSLKSSQHTTLHNSSGSSGIDRHSDASHDNTHTRRPRNENRSIGLHHWLKSRKEWTKSHKLYQPTKKLTIDDPNLSCLSPKQMESIYQSIIEGKRFTKPKPLYFVMDILIYNWKREGLWDPPKTEYNPRSVPE